MIVFVFMDKLIKEKGFDKYKHSLYFDGEIFYRNSKTNECCLVDIDGIFYKVLLFKYQELTTEEHDNV